MNSKAIIGLFDKILEEITQSNHEMSDAIIEVLISLFETDFIESLEIIDKNFVKCLTNSNGFRQVFEVRNDNKSKTIPDRYYCVIDANYCSCDHMRRGVLNDSLLFCKHLIATKISIAMNKYETIPMTDEDINKFWTKHIIN